MNNKNIDIFNYIFSATFDAELDNNDKWDKFETICKENKINGVDFLDDNINYFNLKKSKYFYNILGDCQYDGRFVSLNLSGEKEYYKFKINEVIECVNDIGSYSFKNCVHIFEGMKNEAVREILNKAKEQEILDFDSRTTFCYASNELYTIIYENIKITSNKAKHTDYASQIINNYGTQIYQEGNYNTATITIKSDDELFKLISSKLRLLEMEMTTLNYQRIEEFKMSLREKDKKSILTILSELATLGSVIAPTILSLVSQVI